MKGIEEKIIARYWLERAMDSFQSAKDDTAAGRYSLAISRMYYAVFYSVSAALAAEGEEYGRHSAVRFAFNLRFVKKGTVSEDFGDLYNALYDDRNEGDYLPFVQFDLAYLLPKIEVTSRFLECFRDIVEGRHFL